MDKTKQVIILLLVLAIVFSAASIVISLSALSFDLPERTYSDALKGEGSAVIGLVVEEPPAGGSS